jgi:hypothetical protein
MGQVFNYVKKNKVDNSDKADHLVMLQTKIYNESCKWYLCVCVCVCVCVCENVSLVN